MSLVTTADILTVLKSSALSGSAEYRQIDLLRRQFESIIKRWLKWPVEANDGMGYGNFIEYYDGKGYMDITLRKPWVVRISEVKLTQLGAYGSYNQGFSAVTALVNGTDYSLVFEQDKKSASGILRRLTNNLINIGWWPAMQIYNQNPGGLSYNRGPLWPGGLGNIRVNYDWGFQPSTTLTGATWSGGVATFTFGSAIVVRPTDQFVVSGCTPTTWNGDWTVATVSGDSTQVTARIADDPGAIGTLGSASFIPLDIQSAVCEAVSIARSLMQYGTQLTGEGLGDYNWNGSFNRDSAFGTVRQILSSWRDMSTGLSLA